MLAAAEAHCSLYLSYEQGDRERGRDNTAVVILLLNLTDFIIHSSSRKKREKRKKKNNICVDNSQPASPRLCYISACLLGVTATAQTALPDRHVGVDDKLEYCTHKAARA